MIVQVQLTLARIHQRLKVQHQQIQLLLVLHLQLKHLAQTAQLAHRQQVQIAQQILKDQVLTVHRHQQMDQVQVVHLLQVVHKCRWEVTRSVTV